MKKQSAVSVQRSALEELIAYALDFVDEIDGGNTNRLGKEAAAELAYLQACAAAVEDLSRIEATDATIAMFFKRDAKKLAKMKETK